MKKIILALCLVLPLAACDTTGTMQSPAPLAKTVIDDRGIRYAFLTLDALASLADAGIQAKWIVPGSAKANAIADGLDKIRHFLNAASAAQRAGSVASYQAAFDQAQAAMIEMQKALNSHTSLLLLTPSPTFVSVESTVSRLRAA